MKLSLLALLVGILSARNAYALSTGRVKTLSSSDITLISPSIMTRVAEQDACSTKDEVVAAIGTSKAVVVYVTGGTAVALGVCRILHDHHIGPIGPNDCQNIAGIVAGAVAIIYTATQRSGTVDAPSGNTRFLGDALTSDLAQYFTEKLVEDGTTFGSVEPMPMRKSSLRRRKAGQMLQQIRINGYQFGNATLDATVADFGDGKGQVFVTPATWDNSSRTVRKRHNGPGFKLSFTTREHTKLTKAHQEEMSQKIAHDWAVRADKNKLSQWIGFSETGHTANFYMRIIAEERGYGGNYESVDEPCGQMGRFL